MAPVQPPGAAAETGGAIVAAYAAKPAAADDSSHGVAKASSPAEPRSKPRAAGWADIAWHSTAAMLGAGVIGLPYVFACLGYAGGVLLLALAILVSRDTYMCLVRCYEVDGDEFFERRWRRRRERAAARRRRAALLARLPSSVVLARADSAGGPGGAEDFEDVGEDEHDTDAAERVKDAVTLVCAETGAPMDIAAAERDYCRRRALARKTRRPDVPHDDDGALEAWGGAAAAGGGEAAGLEPPRQPALALFHEYAALSRWAFGRRLGTLLLTPFQVALIVGICVSYTIVGAEALHSIVASSRALAQSAAGAEELALSALPKLPFYLAFAAVQAFLAVACGSIADSGAVSLGGVVASVVYCGIASGVSLAIVAWRRANASVAPEVSYNQLDALYKPAGPATGPDAPGGPTLGAAFAALSALGSIAFCLGGHNIALECQAVLPTPPPSTIPAMTRGVNVAFLITALACFWTGLTGYSAFGASVGENILSTVSAAAVGATTAITGGAGSSSTNPLATWPAASIVAVRVACIVAEFAIFAHVLAAYNVYAQTLWVSVERQSASAWRAWRRGGRGGAGGDKIAAAAAAKGGLGDEEATLPAAAAGASSSSASSLSAASTPPGSPRRRPVLPAAAAAALARAPLRLLYVGAVLAVAVAVPFFGPVAGVVGALCVTPTTFVLPYVLEILRHRTFDRNDDGLRGASGSRLSRGRVLACWVGGLGASAVGLAGTGASIYIIAAQLRAAPRH
jgi:amino acid permease